jgi:NADH-quinone oxidoreductase subunit F/NADP-reducing hydrogenase subunit HndC
MASFKDEYLAHVVDKKCPAHVCKNLMEYYIVPENCIACGVCARSCPVNCIVPTDIPAKKLNPKLPDKFAFGIDAQKCVKCGACISTCKFKAIIKR